MPIYKSILKYGHSNFIFEIIEYCDPINVIEREQYYLDHFDFDYNILEKANSSLGFKHTKETLIKMKGRKQFFPCLCQGQRRSKTQYNNFRKIKSISNR
jgi:group I intron endonuclease